MSGPPRLLEGGSELERQLLSAGRAERPKLRSKRRAATALAVAMGASLWSRLALALRGGAELTRAPLLKLAAVTLVGGATLAAGARFTLSPSTTIGRAPTSVAIAPTAHAASSATQVAEPRAVEAQPMSKQPALALPPENSLEPAARDQRPSGALDGLSAEVQAVDAARAALSEPARALRLLDEYARRYPRGRLQQEALVLRVQALVAAGKREQASSIVQSFSERHPKSPYNRSLASLVARP